MKIQNFFIYSIIRFYYKNFLSLKVLKQKFFFKSKLDAKYQSLVKDLKKNGYAKLPNFFTTEEMSEFRKNIVEQLDALDERHAIEKSDGVISYGKNKMIKKEYGYSRLFKLQEFNTEVIKFLDNQTIKDIVSAYYGREAFAYHNTAQKSAPVKNKGLDWHLDDYLPRFKALVYLYDVDLEDGPISALRYSHKVFWRKLVRVHKMYTGNYNEDSIFPPEEIERLGFEQVVCSGKAGDVFLLDVCAIHRGLPVSQGHKRYALFNFYSPDRG